MTFPFSVEFTKPVEGGGDRANLPAVFIETGCVGLSILLTICGIAMLYHASFCRESRAEVVSWVVEDMKIHMERHAPSGDGVRVSV